MQRWIATALAVLALGTCFDSTAQATNGSDTTARRAWGFTFENDLFFKSDHYYTDGVQLATKVTKDGSTSGPFGLFEFACTTLGCGKIVRHEHGDKFGQLMYTPTRISVATPQPFDRPWAGLLYYASEVELIEEDDRSRTTFTGEFGVTGGPSLAEGTQKFIHRTFSGTEPRGWSNQIPTELGLMVIVERRSSVPRLSTTSKGNIGINTTGTWRVAVGNIMTFAAVGAMLEIGKGISATGSRNEPITPKKSDPPLEAFGAMVADQNSAAPLSSACVFAWLRCSASIAVEARWMIRNIFLDGPMFRDGPSVSKRPLVADVIAGIRLGFPKTSNQYTGPLFVQLTATHRTPEFRSDRISVMSQNWASITIGTEF